MSNQEKPKPLTTLVLLWGRAFALSRVEGDVIVRQLPVAPRQRPVGSEVIRLPFMPDD